MLSCNHAASAVQLDRKPRVRDPQSALILREIGRMRSKASAGVPACSCDNLQSKQFLLLQLRGPFLGRLYHLGCEDFQQMFDTPIS